MYSIVGPLDKKYCIFFQIISLSSILLSIGLFVLYITFPKQNKIHDILFTGVLYFVAFFQNRLLYNMCLNNEKMEPFSARKEDLKDEIRVLVNMKISEADVNTLFDYFVDIIDHTQAATKNTEKILLCMKTFITGSATYTVDPISGNKLMDIKYTLIDFKATKEEFDRLHIHLITKFFTMNPTNINKEDLVRRINDLFIMMVRNQERINKFGNVNPRHGVDAWNAQYDNVIQKSQILKKKLDTIHKNTTPLKYNYERNIVNIKV